MEIPEDHYANNLWKNRDVPFDDSIEKPLTTSQLIKLLEDYANHPSGPISARATDDKLTDQALSSLRAVQIDFYDVDPIFHLLRSVIRPLFSVATSALTPAGRKNEYQDSMSRLSLKHEPSVFSDEAKPWKSSAAWSLPLLTWIVYHIRLVVSPKGDDVLSSAQGDGNIHLESMPKSGSTGPIESPKLLSDLTPLLSPPLLHLLDDSALPIKALGASLLRHFCLALSQIQSIRTTKASVHQSAPILFRTGLVSVFIDALTPNLSLLPTLTPEDESLFVLRRIYPAYIGVIDATYFKGISQEGSPTENARVEDGIRHLNTLVNHTLSSLSHVADSYPTLQAFLLSQVSILLSTLGISAAPHLQPVLLLCRETLCNPFGGVDVNIPVLQACVKICHTACDVLPERIKDAAWWGEILRGVVGAWVVLEDTPEDPGKSKKTSKKIIEIAEDKDEDQKRNRDLLKQDLQILVQKLHHLVDDTPQQDNKPLLEGIRKLVEEETDLNELFSSILHSQEDQKP